MRAAQINTYLRLLEEDGWTYYQYRTETGKDWWKVSYRRPEERQLEVYISGGADCLLCQLPIVLRSDQRCWSALYRFLLQVNHEIKLAKLSLDEEGQLYLSVEALSTTCDATTFRAALTALRTYYEQYHREIELLATNAELAEAWLSLIPRTEQLDIKFVSS